MIAGLPVPRQPRTEREKAYHAELWATLADRARLRRLMATAEQQIRDGNPQAAIVTLQMR